MRRTETAACILSPLPDLFAVVSANADDSVAAPAAVFTSPAETGPAAAVTCFCALVPAAAVADTAERDPAIDLCAVDSVAFPNAGFYPPPTVFVIVPFFCGTSFSSEVEGATAFDPFFHHFFPFTGTVWDLAGLVFRH